MYCCIPTPTTDSNTSTGMIWVTLNMPSAAEECRELSGKCQGIVREFYIVWRVVTLNKSNFTCIKCVDKERFTHDWTEFSIEILA